jgi:S-disulfanyl-L-cysteine oxidoreductase SoxD
VFADQCAACHGTFGEGEGHFLNFVGGAGTLKNDRPELTVGSYWPFAPILLDYINRAMPMPAPHTLSADDVYALTAYILNLNDLVPNEFVAATVCRKSKCPTATISSGPTQDLIPFSSRA